MRSLLLVALVEMLLTLGLFVELHIELDVFSGLNKLGCDFLEQIPLDFFFLHDLASLLVLLLDVLNETLELYAPISTTFAGSHVRCCSHMLKVSKVLE